MKRPLRCCGTLLALLISLYASEKAYPEHGKIIAMHEGQYSSTLPVYTDPYGKTRGGSSVRHIALTYKIETASRIFEITTYKKADSLNVGDEITLRIEKEAAFVPNGKKERRYRVTGVELKPTP